MSIATGITSDEEGSKAFLVAGNSSVTMSADVARVIGTQLIMAADLLDKPDPPDEGATPS